MLKIKRAHPMFTGILVTMDKYEKDELVNGMLNKNTMKGNIKLYQKVFEVGPFVKTMKPGDIVMLNLARYAHLKYEQNSIKSDIMEQKIVRYDIPTEVIDGVEYMLLQENDVVLVIDEYEEVEDSDIVVVTPEIITV